jgi:DNA-binding response OmpR family regulator
MKARPSVLIVDDDITVRKLISTILRRNDVDFATACDGVEAMALLDQRHYQVLLLDLMMPRMNGYEVLERLRGRADRPFVILVSAQSDYANLGLDPAIVHSILRKPFDIEFLVDLVRAASETAPDDDAGTPSKPRAKKSATMARPA